MEKGVSDLSTTNCRPKSPFSSASCFAQLIVNRLHPLRSIYNKLRVLGMLAHELRAVGATDGIDMPVFDHTRSKNLLKELVAEQPLDSDVLLSTYGIHKDLHDASELITQLTFIQKQLSLILDKNADTSFWNYGDNALQVSGFGTGSQRGDFDGRDQLFFRSFAVKIFGNSSGVAYTRLRQTHKGKIIALVQEGINVYTYKRREKDKTQVQKLRCAGAQGSDL